MGMSMLRFLTYLEMQTSKKHDSTWNSEKKYEIIISRNEKTTTELRLEKIEKKLYFHNIKKFKTSIRLYYRL